MQYGYFDNQKREYVIDRIDVPVSWTNYIGIKDLCGVINHTASGYLFHKSPEYNRVTRFRPGGNTDSPGHYVYVRDDDTGEYWSISYLPAGTDISVKAKYNCRHGLSYSKYTCEYGGIASEQTLFIPIDDDVELWDVVIRNDSVEDRNLSIFGYCEFSFGQIEMDNKNFQMSLYSSGTSYNDGIIELDLFYNDKSYRYFTSSKEPDGYDSVREAFIGTYRTERNPKAVTNGFCTGSAELGGNHCGALHNKISLRPGEEYKITYMLGVGGHDVASNIRTKYGDFSEVEKAFSKLAEYWDNKLGKLQINTPNEAMNTMINIWTLYQSEINVMFSRFASFIEVGGRTGLGYRDTAQDAMTIPHSNPEKCKSRIVELLKGLTSHGYGLHLFQPEWFSGEEKNNGFDSPTVIPKLSKEQIIHGIEDACSDDALWLVAAITENIKESGDLDFVNEVITYADHGYDTVYDHMKRILDFSAEQVGENGICKGLRADWNDCLNLGGGESAMVSFLHVWALKHFIGLAEKLGRQDDVKKYGAICEDVSKICEDVLWDKEWYIRGITASGRKIGTSGDAEGKVHIESNTWAVLSGVAPTERAKSAMDSVGEYLYTPWGLMLNAPSYTVPNDEIGFVTRVYKGVKENGAIFSHPNPWAWCAEAILGRGDIAMKYYNALCPYNQNDKIEIRQSEPYSYCQFVMGKEHTAFGRARHPFMTGSGGWSYYAATKYILGIRPDYDNLIVDPCIPSEWAKFEIVRIWRNAEYNIVVENPDGVCKGVKEIYLNGELAEKIPVIPSGDSCNIRIIMGKPLSDC